MIRLDFFSHINCAHIYPLIIHFIDYKYIHKYALCRWVSSGNRGNASTVIFFIHEKRNNVVFIVNCIDTNHGALKVRETSLIAEIFVNELSVILCSFEDERSRESPWDLHASKADSTRWRRKRVRGKRGKMKKRKKVWRTLRTNHELSGLSDAITFYFLPG